MKRLSNYGFSVLRLMIIISFIIALFVLFHILKPNKFLASQYAKNISAPSYMTVHLVEKTRCLFGTCQQHDIEYSYSENVLDSTAWSGFNQSLLAAGYTKTKSDVSKGLSYYDYEGSSSKGTCDLLYIVHSETIDEITLDCRFNDENGQPVYKNPIK